KRIAPFMLLAEFADRLEFAPLIFRKDSGRHLANRAVRRGQMAYALRCVAQCASLIVPYGLAILRCAGGSPPQKPGPRSPADRSRARGHAPGTRTRAQRLPLPEPAEGARHNVPAGRTIQMHRQFGAPDPRAVPRDRASAQARTRPPSTSKDSTRSDRRERVDPERRSFAPIARRPRRIRDRA